MSHHLLDSMLMEGFKDPRDAREQEAMRMDNRYKRATVPETARNDAYLTDVSVNAFIEAVYTGLNFREAMLAVYLAGFEHGAKIDHGKPVHKYPLATRENNGELK